MQEERVAECLGTKVWEIPAWSSQCQQMPGTVSSVSSLRHILQPNTRGSSHPLTSQMKNWGHGAWASSQDHVLVRARVVSEPRSQFLWIPHPSCPLQVPAESDKENQKQCGAPLGFAENWLCQGPLSLSHASASLVRAVPCPCCWHGTSCPTEPARLASSLLLPLLKAAQEALLSIPIQSILTSCRSPPAVPTLTPEPLWHLKSLCFG